uniref:plasmid replication protein RepC n=1 Tax=Hoeflea sp. TaxID=1940281 RepID=UPI003A8D0243
RKDRAGDIESAFGFDISPLLMRSEELAILAQQVAADRAAFRRAKENLTICRRDVRKLISAAIEECAPGDWEATEQIYTSLVNRIPRSPTLGEINDLLDELELLQEEIINKLDLQEKAPKTSSNDAHNERHIQNSNTESFNVFEPRSRNEQGVRSTGNKRAMHEPMQKFPLGMVLRACPEISMYGPGGAIGSWRDMMTAAVVVRSMLGVSPSAYQEACEVMGPENAATAIACILERNGHISSPGGYLRDLTRKASRGEFSLGPALMALLRAHGQDERLVG